MMARDLLAAVDRYISTLLAQQDDMLLESEPSLDAANLPQISVSPNQGKLLHPLALLGKARNILELETLCWCQ
ncbi:MAG: hypothetical protein ACFB4I_11000 [Cyanophyceae cyanobacterium]